MIFCQDFIIKISSINALHPIAYICYNSSLMQRLEQSPRQQPIPIVRTQWGEKKVLLSSSIDFNKKGMLSKTGDLANVIKLLRVQKTPPPTADKSNLEKETLPPDIKAMLQDKYAKVGHILQAVEAFSQIDEKALHLDEENPYLDQNTYMRVKDIFTQAFTPIAEAFGFQIVEGYNPYYTDGYRERIQQHAREHEDKVTAVSEQELSFTPAKQSEWQTNNPDVDFYLNTAYVIPQGRWYNHPDVKQYTSVFNRFSDIQKTVYGEPPKPSDSIQYRDLPYISLSPKRIAGTLLIMGKSILWEGFNGRTINLEDFAAYINAILQVFDLHVDVKQDQANQTQQNTTQQQAVI